MTEHLSDLRDRSGAECEQKSFPAGMGIVPPDAKVIRYKVSIAILSPPLPHCARHSRKFRRDTINLMSAVALALRVLSIYRQIVDLLNSESAGLKFH